MRNRIITLCFTLACLNGCIGGGTHGYIKRYRYAVSKYELERVVHQIIKTNPSVIQDSIKGYYNNDTQYISLGIKEKKSHYTYTLHFYGGKAYWDTSKTSAISFVYAYDEKRRGGSEGNGGVSFGLKKKLAAPFERELVFKIDSVLGMKHTEE